MSWEEIKITKNLIVKVNIKPEIWMDDADKRELAKKVFIEELAKKALKDA